MPLNKFKSLRLWLPMLTIVSAAVGGVVLLLIQLEFHEERFEQNFRQNQILRTCRLQSEIERWIQRDDPEMVQSVIAETAVIPEVKAAMFVDSSNSIVAATRREYIGTPLTFEKLALPEAAERELFSIIQSTRQTRSGMARFTADRNDMITCYPMSAPMHEGELETRRGGLVLVCYDLRAQKAVAASDVRLEFVFDFGGVLFVAASLGVGVHYLVTRRLEELKRALNQFARDGARPSRKSGLGDEISYLFDGFNEMAATIDGEMAERKQVAEALQKSIEEIQDLYNNAPCGYHSLDKDGVFVRINDTELKWLGYTREEVLGKKKFTDLTTPEGVKLFTASFPRFKETGSVRNLEFNLVRKDGSLLPVVVNATAIRDRNGNYLVSRSTLHDITERKQAEQELLKLNHELEARVSQRTAQLEANNEELERMNRLFVGRELQMVKLKEQLRELQREGGTAAADSNNQPS